MDNDTQNVIFKDPLEIEDYNQCEQLIRDLDAAILRMESQLEYHELNEKRGRNKNVDPEKPIKTRHALKAAKRNREHAQRRLGTLGRVRRSRELEKNFLDIAREHLESDTFQDIFHRAKSKMSL